MVKRDKFARVRVCSKAREQKGVLWSGGKCGVEALKGGAGWNHTNTFCECLYRNACMVRLRDISMTDTIHKPIWCNYTLKLNIAFFSALGSLVGGAKWEGKHRELQIFQGDGHF